MIHENVQGSRHFKHVIELASVHRDYSPYPYASVFKVLIQQEEALKILMVTSVISYENKHFTFMVGQNIKKVNECFRILKHGLISTSKY